MSDDPWKNVVCLNGEKLTAKDLKRAIELLDENARKFVQFPTLLREDQIADLLKLLEEEE